MNLTEASKQAMKEDLDKLFSNGVEVYKVRPGRCNMNSVCAGIFR